MSLRVPIRLAAMIIAGVLIHQLIVMPTKCNQAIRLVEQRTRTALSEVRQHEAIRTARQNIRALESAAGGCARQFDHYLLLALNKSILGRYDEAIGHLTAAATVADRPEIYFDRGILYLRQGRIDEAVADFRVGIEFNPNLLYQLDLEIQKRVKAAMPVESSR